MIMNELFVREMKYVKIKGKLEQVPIYGNFCLRCGADSNKVHDYGDNSLLICHVCDYVFTMDDMTKIITDFWTRRGYC